MIRPRGNRAAVVFGGCWAAIGLALGILLARVNGLPESVPVFVSPFGTPTMWAPTSIPMVTRIAIMGAGQLGAVTALAHASRESGLSGWALFFELMAVAVASKTMAESVVLAGTGTAWGEMMSPALNAITIAIVVAFLLSAALMWRRGCLREFPEVRSSRARATIVCSVALWLAFATIPYWW